MGRADTRTRAGWPLAARALGAAILATATLAPAASAGAAPVAAITATASPAALDYGATIMVTGSVGIAAALPVVLEADPYPYRGFSKLASASSAADGSYTFAGVRPDRNSRLRVVA